MRSNLKSYNKLKLKRKLEDDGEKHDGAKTGGGGYYEDLRKSENFEVGDYTPPWVCHPRFPGDRIQFRTGISCPAKIYDSLRKKPRQDGIVLDKLICFSRLAISFYNIRMGTHFRFLNVRMTTAHGSPSAYTYYLTFEAQRNTEEGSVTFQTKLITSKKPCLNIQIFFVRVKPDPDNSNHSNNSQPSESDHNAQVTLLSQVINAYTIDSRLDSQYNLALYLSQYALVSYNYRVLKQFVVAKHDMESLKVLKLVKPDSEVRSASDYSLILVHLEVKPGMDPLEVKSTRLMEGT
ncbi:hypothetical protein POM88_036178 [Heracleum sosnowskyi]|uniref:Uncharacterized protein n=1 Tax=Heracleum sosnowskyi TaxID=360622 RepID=A0AAD8HMX3_9APIA|nr:hypothetical protein POM88_036178 [Heracleum sosnowskyi]